jgi:hypothetical protein
VPPDDAGRCRLAGTQGGTSPAFRADELVVSGQTFHLVGEVRAGWQPGDVLECAGASRLAVVAPSAAGPRLALAAMLLLGALISAVLAVLGRRSRRSARS